MSPASTSFGFAIYNVLPVSPPVRWDGCYTSKYYILYSNLEGKGWGHFFFSSQICYLTRKENLSSSAQQIFIYISLIPVVSAQIVKPVNHFLHDLWLVPYYQTLPAPKIILKCTSFYLCECSSILFVLLISKPLNYLEFIFGCGLR